MSRPIFCDPMDCSPPGSSVHRISQARILEWVAISFSRWSSQLGHLALAGGFFNSEPLGKPQQYVHLYIYIVFFILLSFEQIILRKTVSLYVTYHNASCSNLVLLSVFKWIRFNLDSGEKSSVLHCAKLLNSDSLKMFSTCDTHLDIIPHGNISLATLTPQCQTLPLLLDPSSLVQNRSGRSPGGGHCNPLQYSCLENSHGHRSLAGYSPWGRTESDMTEWQNTVHSYPSYPWSQLGSCSVMNVSK